MKKDDSIGLDNHYHSFFAQKENDPPPRVLIYTNDEGIRESVVNAMLENGFEVASMKHGSMVNAISNGLAVNRFACFDVLVADVSMSGVIGLEWIDRVRGKSLCPAVVVISSFINEQIYEEADRLGCVTVFRRPFSLEQLIHTVEAATTWSRMLLSVGYPGLTGTLASAS
jgi:CheY-like chemotaxis protein